MSNSMGHYVWDGLWPPEVDSVYFFISEVSLRCKEQVLQLREPARVTVALADNSLGLSSALGGL